MVGGALNLQFLENPTMLYNSHAQRIILHNPYLFYKLYRKSQKGYSFLNGSAKKKGGGHAIKENRTF